MSSCSYRAPCRQGGAPPLSLPPLPLLLRVIPVSVVVEESVVPLRDVLTLGPFVALLQATLHTIGVDSVLEMHARDKLLLDITGLLVEGRERVVPAPYLCCDVRGVVLPPPSSSACHAGVSVGKSSLQKTSNNDTGEKSRCGKRHRGRLRLRVPLSVQGFRCFFGK